MTSEERIILEAIKTIFDPSETWMHEGRQMFERLVSLKVNFGDSWGKDSVISITVSTEHISAALWSGGIAEYDIASNLWSIYP